jgi:hypothetical protein
MNLPAPPIDQFVETELPPEIEATWIEWWLRDSDFLEASPAICALWRRPALAETEARMAVAFVRLQA